MITEQSQKVEKEKKMLELYLALYQSARGDAIKELLPTVEECDKVEMQLHNLMIEIAKHKVSLCVLCRYSYNNNIST